MSNTVGVLIALAILAHATVSVYDTTSRVQQAVLAMSDDEGFVVRTNAGSVPVRSPTWTITGRP